MTSLALFDFDGTMRKGDSIVDFLRTAHRLKAISAWEGLRDIVDFLRFRLKMLDECALKNKVLHFRMTLDSSKRAALDRVFTDEVLLPHVYADAVREMQACRDAGMMTVIVSASTDHYMELLTGLLPVDAVLSTAILPDGKTGPNCKGPEKVCRIRKLLAEKGIEADFAASRAYGDSKSDIPMLSLVGTPVLVNPKPALRRAFPNAAVKRWRES